MTSFEDKQTIIIQQLRDDKDRLLKIIDDIKADVKHELDRNIGGSDKRFIDGLKCGYGECLAIIDSHMKEVDL